MILPLCPSTKVIGNLPHFCVGGADFFDARVFLAQQIEQSGRGVFGRILKFHQGVRLTFFRRPALEICGMRDVRIVIIQALHFLV